MKSWGLRFRDSKMASLSLPSISQKPNSRRERKVGSSFPPREKLQNGRKFEWERMAGVCARRRFSPLP